MIGYSKSVQTGKGTVKKSQTEKNIDANKELDKIYAEKKIDFCEAKVSKDCMPKEIFVNGHKLKHTYAHRHKRIWYRDKPTLLYAFNETIRACLNCHVRIEPDRKLTNVLFTKLRGKLS